jgi:hypothetical protein
MLISEKITLFMAIWMVIIFFLTIDVIPEIFFILTFIGFLIVKVFTDRYTLTPLRTRLNIFIFFFFIVFSLLIVKRIISFLII